MATFEPGEIVIYVRPGSPVYGTEVEVLSHLMMIHHVWDSMRGSLDHNVMGYKIYGPGCTPGVPAYALPQWLRKKPSPAKEWFDKMIKTRPVEKELESVS